MVLGAVVTRLDDLGRRVPGSQRLNELMRSMNLGLEGAAGMGSVVLGVLILYLAYTRVLPMVM